MREIFLIYILTKWVTTLYIYEYFVKKWNNIDLKGDGKNGRIIARATHFTVDFLRQFNWEICCWIHNTGFQRTRGGAIKARVVN